MSAKNLLIELFVEELPPKALKKLGEAFAAALGASLKTQGLAPAEAKVVAYATPRRLAVHVSEVATQAADKAVTQKLMPVAVGIDADGQPTPALLKKLASMGVDASAVPKLKREGEGKAEALFFDNLIKGASLAEGLQIALDETIAKLPIPKVMTYQLADGWSSVNFVRPAHGLVALHGADIVTITALGLAAGRVTQGHRFEASVPSIAIKNANSYVEQLKIEGAVIASFDERRAEILRQLTAAALKASTGLSSSLKPIGDEVLLDEVTALVERPNVLLGQFESEYLEVPQECLILTMKANQKYFPLLDANGKLTNKFLIVSNISPANTSAVIGGNERVVRPRLADAKFFFDQDRKKTLESRVPKLAKVVYHNKLGTQGERIEQVRLIARAIGQQLGGDELAVKADKAALLAKADLLTDMVGEFPELQGIMGGYYAKHDGLGTEIADAIQDHYKPRFAGDELPRNKVGVVLALADKLQTLAGLFSIGEKPTGDKDPFALRRHALGVLRIVLENNLPFSVYQLVEFGEKPLPNLTAVIDSLAEFILERLAGMLKDQGYSAQEIEAVFMLKAQQVSLSDIVNKRLPSVQNFAKLPEAPSLAAANKRVINILKKTDLEVSNEVNMKLLKEPAEIALYNALQTIKPVANAAFDNGDYTASLKALAALKTPVDDFFDNVMVNADDPALRANRLALLSQLHSAMNRVADLSKLAS